VYIIYFRNEGFNHVGTAWMLLRLCLLQHQWEGY